ncbi:hypothetical protein CFR73_12855 [Novacetimonas maltaceti]|uniref:Uncharacterized protein n=1 Tax=Novacetimonas maltaceti TaxID=1203393 RepID=A0A2S3VZY5_9PROT|nr:hypothetical protein [Novacetimonas maltaceti]POF62181.1 hypothetical protein KMAL_21950 [Novacetimonas maltaceti]PYD59213.1 hypothetical protein CFR73_12855 [Novacetimonas maltaceti]BCZ75948.1 hypothetical protein [Komagataeibacter phage phiKM1]
MTVRQIIARTIANLRTARARLRLPQQDRRARPVDPTKVTPEWLEKGLGRAEEWRTGQAAGTRKDPASARVTVGGRWGVDGFIPFAPPLAPVQRDQLVEDLLAIVTVLKRKRRDCADVVEYGPAVIAQSRATGSDLDMEIERVMAAIHQVAPGTPEPAPYEADRSVREQLEANFISNALFKSFRARKRPIDQSGS